MTSQRMIEPGVVLAGRYRIEDLVEEHSGARTWRAFDDALNRSVGIQALPAGDPRAAAFLAAARQSVAVGDPRFLRVLDAIEDEQELVYIVREWAKAQPLEALLREEPLGNRRAADVVGQVAQALAVAHEAGLYHRRIDVSSILVKDSGAVRIVGLGTRHALDSNPVADGASTTVGASQDAEQADVTALGKVLYACLVARWPGGRDFGLPAAPTEHGRLLRARQVRAGVSREADQVCDRILGSPPRHHRPPLRSARDIARALALVGDDDTGLPAGHPSLEGTAGGLPHVVGTIPAGPPPAVVPGRKRAVKPPDPPTPMERSMAAAKSATSGDRALILLGIALLIVVAAATAFFVGRQSAGTVDESGPRQSSSATATEPPQPVKVASVSDFDPQGTDGGENPELAPYAVDGDPTTDWHTLSYQNTLELGGLKSGVGLVLDLGVVRQIGAVDVDFGAAPNDVTIWVSAADATAEPTSLKGMVRFGSESDTGERSEIASDTPRSTRYVVVWLTQIPEETATTDRGVIDEIKVLGWTP